MYSEKLRKRIVAADNELKAKSLASSHTDMSSALSAVALAVSNGIHQGFLYADDDDIDLQIKLAKKVGLDLPLR